MRIEKQKSILSSQKLMKHGIISYIRDFSIANIRRGIYGIRKVSLNAIQKTNGKQ